MAAKIIIRAGGSMRAGPERDMVDDYINRANLLARQTGFLSVEEQAVDVRSCRSREEETQKLFDSIPNSALCFALDERGKAFASRQMAKTLSQARDDGQAEIYLVIGAADGFEPSAIPASARKWAFGPQTWPHKLVRVMIAEQTYRALSILAGTPYHRD
jgi:23S rRNA (pseudouridine1915-N3)-methyltransferase